MSAEGRPPDNQTSLQHNSIRAIDGVLLPAADAVYLISIINFLEGEGRRNGATPSARLVEIRRGLTQSTRTDASDDASVKPQVVALTAESLVTVEEAAEVLGIKPDSVRWHYRRGNLSGRKIGGKIWLDAGSIEQFVSTHAKGDLDVRRP